MYTKDWFGQWAIYSPEKVAIEEYDTGRHVTYRELNHNANRLCGYLAGCGLKTGDRILIVAEHSVELVTLFGAALKAGYILVPVNYRLAAEEIGFLVNDCRPALILYDEAYESKLIATVDIPKLTTPALRNMVKKSPDKQIIWRDLPEDAPLFLLYTSGTTGHPKGALYTYKMLFWNSLNTTMSLALTPQDHTINCMPSFHTGGWNVLLTPLLHRGATVGLLRKFDATQVLKLLEKKGSTLFMGVPTMLKMMRDCETFNRAQLQQLRYFIVGGEAMPHTLIQAWHKKGVSIRQGYGLTEAGPNLTSLHQCDAERKLGSIGKPNFYIEAALFDENMQPVRAGDIGEFCIRGEVVCPGYWENEQATTEAFHDGWFRTGDLMRQDSEGYLYVVDRKKCMYISGGENVYPAEVEKVLCQAKGVQEVAVVGVPDEKWGEAGRAFLVMKEGHTTDHLAAFCLDKLAKFKIPKYYSTVAALPKTDSGKIDRKILKQLKA